MKHCRALLLCVRPQVMVKPTLMSTWAKSLAMPCAWLSLDATDNDPTIYVALG
ncbi:MAG: hypothetical protein IPG70_15400 [Moraxellaceae bacterium]|nr:hypothetical protein [Moraxellaceae bacterium]